MDSHEIFSRLVGRVMGALDIAHADETLKRTVKAYIWQAEQDLNKEKQGGIKNDGREQN